MKIINIIMFFGEITLFFLSGFFTANGKIILSIVSLLSGIIFAVILGNRIFKEGMNALR